MAGSQHDLQVVRTIPGSLSLTFNRHPALPASLTPSRMTHPPHNNMLLLLLPRVVMATRVRLILLGITRKSGIIQRQPPPHKVPLFLLWEAGAPLEGFPEEGGQGRQAYRAVKMPEHWELWRIHGCVCVQGASQASVLITRAGEPQNNLNE